MRRCIELCKLFRRKATSTLKMRVGSIGLYLAWFTTTYPDASPYPVGEEDVYDHACKCRDDGASASRLDTFISTLRFMGSMLKIPGAIEAADSARVQGVSHDMLLTRRPRHRAGMLTPTMLVWLELACYCLSSAFGRMLASAFLLCCYGRLRPSDANRIRHASLVGRYFEGSLTRTKTSQCKEKATAFIPLVVPGFGVLGNTWILEFLDARKQLELDAVPPLGTRDQDLAFIMVLSYDSLSYDTKLLPIQAGEVTDRLRLILSMVFSSESLRDVSSHSLKTMMLAYMNIFGASFQTNELLGYHVNKEHRCTQQTNAGHGWDAVCSEQWSF